MKPRVYAGIDVGAEGHLALIVIGSAGHEVRTIPLGDRPEIVIRSVLVPFREAGMLCKVALEKTYAFKGVAASGAHSLGIASGRVLGALGALSLPYEAIRPQEWKALILKGTAKDKAAAIDHVRDLYPSVRLTKPKGKVPDHNIAEAVCLAEYARRTHQ